MLAVAVPARAGAQQSHTEIHAFITAFVHAQTKNLPGQVSIKVDEIDRRVALPTCQALEAFLPPGSQLFGNSTVGVRCSQGAAATLPANQDARTPDRPDKNSWTLFVPVHIKISANLLVAAKPLQQGRTLYAEDLASQSGELTHAGILTDPQQAIGKILRYSIGAGQVLKQDMLRAPYAVTQGQTVRLQAEGTGFKVSSEGQALNNAAEGQNVQVRTISGQVVSGTAQSNGTVAVRP